MIVLSSFYDANIKTHLIVSFVIRLLLISYGIYHDQYSSVPYTDIDYKVFTDAARYILHDKSPYDRYTYRYSPLLALILIPNVAVHHVFGKILFSIIDIGVGLLIRLILVNTLKELKMCTDKNTFKTLLVNNEQHIEEKEGTNNVKQRKRYKQFVNRKSKTKESDPVSSIIYNIADKSTLLWLYNPLAIGISTRGNCDSLAAFIVLHTLYFLQIKKKPFIAGLIHGLSVHFRLYPLVYSLTLFMYLSKYSYYSPNNIKTVKQKLYQGKNRHNGSLISFENVEKKTIFKVKYLLYLVPNANQLKLIAGTILGFTSLTCACYYTYGYRFLYETYIYHFTRVDFRHNFSLYFYVQYLSAWVRNIGIWQKALVILPQLVLLTVFSIRFGLNRFSLNFAILLQTIVFVIYNRVLTSQYFVWVLAILPLCLWQIKITKKRALFILTIWFVAQAAWLLPAYLLEFQGENTFFFIWIQSVSFFCANVAIIGRLIIHFMNDQYKLNLEKCN